MRLHVLNGCSVVLVCDLIAATVAQQLCVLIQLRFARRLGDPMVKIHCNHGFSELHVVVDTVVLLLLPSRKLFCPATWHRRRLTMVTRPVSPRVQP